MELGAQYVNLEATGFSDIHKEVLECANGQVAGTMKQIRTICQQETDWGQRETIIVKASTRMRQRPSPGIQGYQDRTLDVSSNGSFQT